MQTQLTHKTQQSLDYIEALLTVKPGPDPIKLRQQIEEQEHWVVKAPPTLRRIALVRYEVLGVPQKFERRDELFEDLFTWDQLKLKCSQGNVKVLRVLRVRWAVCRDGTHHKGLIRSYWERVQLAQAERDGLLFHYAKYLMTKGTAAQ